MVGEKAEHVGSARERRLDAVGFAAGNAVLHRNTAPGFLALVEFTGHERDQIRGDRLGLAPSPGFHSGLGIGDLLELAIGYGHPIPRNRDDHLGGCAVVRIIVNGNVIAGVFGLALGPDFLWLRRIALVGQNEVKALLRLALVTNGHLVLFAGFRGAAEIHVQLGVIGRKMSILPIEAGTQNG